MQIIDEILNKIGVKSYEDLNYEERKTIERITEGFHRKPVTVEDMTKFLTNEERRVKVELYKHDNSPQTDAHLKAYARLIVAMLSVLSLEEAARKQAEQDIASILKVNSV